jgi:hypothetical protein
VPLLDAGPSEQHLLFLANAGEHRVNAGIVSESGAAAELLVYDAAAVDEDDALWPTPGRWRARRRGSPLAGCLGARSCSASASGGVYRWCFCLVAVIVVILVIRWQVTIR